MCNIRNIKCFYFREGECCVKKVLGILLLLIIFTSSFASALELEYYPMFKPAPWDELVTVHGKVQVNAITNDLELNDGITVYELNGHLSGIRQKIGEYLYVTGYIDTRYLDTGETTMRIDVYDYVE